ncbi:MAG: S8 family serine peptidase [Firmicutes bacterium]|nr:S8 family serine peptidase [Bacillota bacterium]
MGGTIGRTPEYFSFSQLNKIVDAFEGNKAPEAPSIRANALVSDQVNLGGAESQDVMILPGNGLMKSFKEIDSDSVANFLQGKGVEVEEKLDVLNGVTAKLDQKSIENLKEQGYQVYDNSPRSLLPSVPRLVNRDPGGKPWDMPKIDDVNWTGTSELHKQGLTGKGQVIAIIDSGYEHPAKPLVAWKDVVEGSDKPFDPNGHGTHVAGDAMKMAPDADLVGIRVMNAQGSGRPSDIVKGVQWAIQNKEKYNISVINMSLGGAPDGVPYYMDPINKAVEKAVESGISVVAAAGNSGPEQHTIGSPADDPKAFSIGAALNPTTVSDFSSRGPTDDNMSKPDIVAPGEFITSWAVPNSQLDKIATTVDTLRRMSPDQLRKLFTAKPDLIKALGLPKDLLKNDDTNVELITKTHLPPMYKPTPETLAGPGTSFASPEVAGIVADLRQGHPAASPDQVKDALMGTADNMGSQYGKLDQGSGFVRADKAHKKLA